jgi:thymidylate synthase
MRINLIAAFDNRFLIGDSNTFRLPWNIKEELNYFRKITSDSIQNYYNYLICGYNTWYHSLKDIKLKNRKLIVINRDIQNIKEYNQDTFFINNINILEQFIDNQTDIYKIFCIGGRKLYSYFLNNMNLLDNIFITKINKKFKGDIFFPYQDISNFKLVKYERIKTSNNIYLDFCKYNIDYNYNPESSYINLVKNILDNGIEELLWFLKGQTDNKILKSKKVKIWNWNSTREFLDSRGLQRLKEDDCGAIYSHQMRHFGAEYINCNTDYNGKGFDQIQYVIDEIKNNPNSRRILFSMWNPTQLKDMCLPPCHILYQFRCYGDKLCLSMYQRSGDTMLGIPFNITSSCLLLYIIAKLTNKIPWKFIHSIGDNHIYMNHLEGAQGQIKRNYLPFPGFQFNKNKTFQKIEDFTYEDFEIIGYISHPTIKFPFAI